MWFFLALASALIYSFRSIIEKHTIRTVNKYVLGFGIRLFTLPFLLIPFLFNPQLANPLWHADFLFWFAVLFVSFINSPLETYFYNTALQDEEVTTVLPILSLGPIVTLFIASISLKEIPTGLGLIGILLIAFGIYTLKIKHIKEGVFEPFKHLGRNKGVQYMFIVMLSQSIGAIFDKVGVTHANAYVYAFFNYFFVSVSLLILTLIKAKSHTRQLFTHYKNFLLLGLIIASYTLLYLVALESGFVAYVSAIKNSYILFAIILGILFLKEKEGPQKIIAGFIIVIGLVLVKLFS